MAREKYPKLRLIPPWIYAVSSGPTVLPSRHSIKIALVKITNDLHVSNAGVSSSLPLHFLAMWILLITFSFLVFWAPVWIFLLLHRMLFSVFCWFLIILPGEGNGNPLQYSCLWNPMDRGAWWATIHGVPKSWTRLNDFCVCVWSSFQPLNFKMGKSSVLQ